MKICLTLCSAGNFSKMVELLVVNFLGMKPDDSETVAISISRDIITVCVSLKHRYRQWIFSITSSATQLTIRFTIR